jgi:hypothetical protein
MIVGSPPHSTPPSLWSHPSAYCSNLIFFLSQVWWCRYVRRLLTLLFSKQWAAYGKFIRLTAYIISEHFMNSSAEYFREELVLRDCKTLIHFERNNLHSKKRVNNYTLVATEIKLFNSSWLQIQRSRFDSWCCQIFWEVVGLERGPLSLVSAIEELLKRKGSGSGLKNRGYGSRDPPCWPRDTPLPTNVGACSSEIIYASVVFRSSALVK